MFRLAEGKLGSLSLLFQLDELRTELRHLVLSCNDFLFERGQPVCMPPPGMACAVHLSEQLCRLIGGGAFLASKIGQELSLRRQPGFKLLDASREALAFGCARLGDIGCLANARRKLTQLALAGQDGFVVLAVVTPAGERAAWSNDVAIKGDHGGPRAMAGLRSVDRI